LGHVQASPKGRSLTKNGLFEEFFVFTQISTFYLYFYTNYLYQSIGN